MRINLRRFLAYYRPYRGLFILDLLCAALVAAIDLVIPLGVRYITGDLLAGELSWALPQIYSTGAALTGLILAKAGCFYVVDYYGHTMGAMMERDIRRDLFGHLGKLGFGFYDGQKTGQLMSRLTADTQDLAEFYHHVPEDWMIYALEFVGSLAILAVIHAPLTLIVCAFLPLIALFTAYFNRRMKRILMNNKRRIADINAQVEDTLSGIRAVQSFTNEDLEQKKFDRENERFLESRRAGYRSEAVCYGGSEALVRLVTVAVVVFGGAWIARAELALADLIAFMLYASYLTKPLEKLMWMTEQFQMGITSFQRIQELMDVEPEIRDSEGAVELGRARGEIELQHASFRYSAHPLAPSGSLGAQPASPMHRGPIPASGPSDAHGPATDEERRPRVLRDVNLRVPAGDYVAVVGPSGVGKTTLCSLIPRFYDVTEGRVLVDGVDVRDIKLSSLRRNIGVVQQDVYLFSGSVIDNIRYGRPDAADWEVVEAAKKADAHEFIMALPHGYQTDIGQRGVRLSGGQRQRLSIARAFLKDPPILILDEATSSLDNQSERAVQRALGELSRGRTTLVIAHRLSTVKSARRIVVLTDRGIEEQGTHDELIQGGGAYARLYRAEFEG